MMQNLPRKFNPGLNQDDKSLMLQYVVRLPILKNLLATIIDNSSREICQHCLYYGPRGRGKTMLMARVAAELRVNPQFSEHWIPIRLLEEGYYEISNIAEFWLEVMSELTLQLTGNHQQSAQQTLQHLKTNWSHPDLQLMAQAAVLEQLNIINKRAVLMVENLHQLIEETDENFGWEIRRVMQNEPRIMFLATATTRFDNLDNAKEPFFEIFATAELLPLKRKEVAILWNTLTNSNKTNNEIAPLAILTGGSPRLLNILAQFSKNSSIRELMENLTGLVDEYTEYFKSQLDALAPKERRVFLALADLWTASTAKEVAERARMDIRPTSSLLGRLEHKGAIKVNQKSARKKIYLIGERLFCIYYKLRRERNQDAVINSLVQFMVDFYTPEEINKIKSLHLDKTLLTNDELVFLKKLSTILDFENDASTISPSIEKDKLYDINDFWTALTLSKQGNVKQAIAAYGRFISHYQDNDNLEVIVMVIKAMFNQAVTYEQMGDNEKALAGYQQVIQQFGQHDEAALLEPVAIAMINQANILAIMQQWLQATESYQQALLYITNNKEIANQHILASTASLGQLLSQYAQKLDAPQSEKLTTIILEANQQSAAEERMTLAIGIGALLPVAVALDILQKNNHHEELQPLIVALQLEKGEEIRTSEEMLEVAADVSKRMQAIRES